MNDGDQDAQLIERVGHGDAAAARLLVSAKLPRVLGLATRLLRDPGEAEDVAQEAFLRAWKVAPRWQPHRARFDTWLHTVVLNLCRDRLRRRRGGADEAVPEVRDPAPDAEAAMLDAEQGERVAQAIAALPDRQREAIVLVHYQDLSGADAATALDISVEALESLLARGRRSLRARLAPSQEHDGHG